MAVGQTLVCGRVFVRFPSLSVGKINSLSLCGTWFFLQVKDLSDEELAAIRAEVNKYMIEGDLRRFTALNIKRLKDIQCYRGRRHIMNLPCRGILQSFISASSCSLSS